MLPVGPGTLMSVLGPIQTQDTQALEGAGWNQDRVRQPAPQAVGREVRSGRPARRGVPVTCTRSRESASAWRPAAFLLLAAQRGELWERPGEKP